VIWDLRFVIWDLRFVIWDFSHLAILGELGGLIFQDQERGWEKETGNRRQEAGGSFAEIGLAIWDLKF